MQTSHLNGLRALEAVLRLGNFRAAAGALGVTPAAVGQQVRGLEDYIGRPLFRRLPAGVEPTAEAALLAPRLTLAFRGLSEALTELKGAPGGLGARRLAVSATNALTEGWLSPALPEFFQRCGEVDMQLSTGPAPVNLLDGSFDFALRYGPQPSAAHEYLPLFPDLIGPMCTADFARRYGLHPGAGRLAGVLVDVENHTDDPEWLDWPEWCARFGVAMPERPLRPGFAQFDNGLRMARAGIGLVIGSVTACLPALREGALVLPFGPERLVRGGYLFRLVWAKDRRLSPVQRAFRDWIEARAATHRAEIAAFLGPGGARLVAPEP